MKFQTHTVSQSEVIGNFTLFSQFSLLFFTPFPKKISRVTTTHHPLPTYGISDSYRQSIRSYWQFQTFFPNFHTFFSHLFQFFSRVTTTHHPPPTYEISDAYRQSIRNYWQFHTFFPIFTPFFHTFSKCFFTGHHNSSPPTYI